MCISDWGRRRSPTVSSGSTSNDDKYFYFMTLLRFMESLIYLLSDRGLTQTPKSCFNMNQQYQIPLPRIILIYQEAQYPVIDHASTIWYFSNLLKFRHVSLTSSRGCFSPSGAPGDKQFYMPWASYHSISNFGVLLKSSTLGIKQP